MEMNLAETWAAMGTPVRAVVIVLTIQAIACITVMIDRIIMLWRSARASAAFAATAGPLFDEGRHREVLALAGTMKASHLATFMHTGIKTFLDRRDAGDRAERAAELTRRALDRKGESLSGELQRGMNVLASTGSTAPFVGLLGTVLGIIHAFKLIASSGSGGIGAIGAAIGESLIVTGYGLLVAIPVVLIFNWLSARLQKYESGLVNAASEIVDRLETSVPSEGAPQARMSSSGDVAGVESAPGAAVVAMN